MLTILLLFSFLNSSSSAPVAGSQGDRVPLVLFGRQLPASVDVANQRELQDIIWSCLATIVACTWVAVHPNMPGTWDSGWVQFKRKVLTMIYAMVAPECTIVWALRQSMAAQRISREFNDRDLKGKDPQNKRPDVAWYLAVRSFFRESWAFIWAAIVTWFRGPPRVHREEWTAVHGFFVQMGGFILYKGKTPVRVLSFDDLMALINKGHVDAPIVTEEELNDKSKGDFLTKLFATLQTSWFAFQCFARWAQHLHVTELEVVTLAFAALNIFTYGLWWHKPQNAVVAVRVQLRPDSRGWSDDHNDMGQAAAEAGGAPGGEDKEIKRGSDSRSHGNIGQETLEEVQEVLRGEGGEEAKHNSPHDLEGTAEGKVGETLRGGDVKERWLGIWVKRIWNDGWYGRFVLLPRVLHAGILRPLDKMVGAWHDKGPFETLRVPMFHAEESEIGKVIVPLLSLCILFGGVHLIPWASSFPSAPERWLWLSSALLLTTVPALGILVALSRKIDDYYGNPPVTFYVYYFLETLLNLGMALYPVARAIILAVAFSTLRALPPDAYADVEWTTFIGHV